jgi:hypothetical protein
MRGIVIAIICICGLAFLFGLFIFLAPLLNITILEPMKKYAPYMVVIGFLIAVAAEELIRNKVV